MMYRPFLFVSTIVVGILVTMGESIQPDEFTRYTTVTGFFQQDDPATNPTGFDYVSALLVVSKIDNLSSNIS